MKFSYLQRKQGQLGRQKTNIDVCRLLSLVVEKIPSTLSNSLCGARQIWCLSVISKFMNSVDQEAVIQTTKDSLGLKGRMIKNLQLSIIFHGGHIYVYISVR